MNRRDTVLGLLAIGAAPWAFPASPANRVFRLGFLVNDGTPKDFLESSIARELKILGYEPGKNLIVEVRSYDLNDGRLPGLAAELVAAKVDVIVARESGEAVAAKRATSTIPIVMVYGGSPVELGLAKSLAHPGGNVTGTLVQQPESVGKTLQILREIMPHISRIATLGDATTPGMEPYARVLSRAAEELKFRNTLFSIVTKADLESAFKQIARERSEAIYFAANQTIDNNIQLLFEFAARQRVPTFSTYTWYVKEGALFALTADLKQVGRRTAAIIDKILRGTNPAEIPIEMPIDHNLWINMKTARMLGIKIPQSVLLQVHTIIE